MARELQSRFIMDSQIHMCWDYTFIPEYTDEPNQEQAAADVLDTLHKSGLDTEFSELFEMKIGDIRTAEDFENAYSMNEVLEQAAKFPASDDRDVLLNNLGFADFPSLISLSGIMNCFARQDFPRWNWEKARGLYIWTAVFLMTGRLRS